MKKLVIVLVCIIYVVSPIDLVPDLIPGVGMIDDLAAIGLTLRQLAQGGPPRLKGGR